LDYLDQFPWPQKFFFVFNHCIVIPFNYSYEWLISYLPFLYIYIKKTFLFKKVYNFLIHNDFRYVKFSYIIRSTVIHDAPLIFFYKGHGLNEKINKKKRKLIKKYLKKEWKIWCKTQGFESIYKRWYHSSVVNFYLCSLNNEKKNKKKKSQMISYRRRKKNQRARLLGRPFIGATCCLIM
jgi:hypothetical protein